MRVQLAVTPREARERTIAASDPALGWVAGEGEGEREREGEGQGEGEGEGEVEGQGEGEGEGEGEVEGQGEGEGEGQGQGEGEGEGEGGTSGWQETRELLGDREPFEEPCWRERRMYRSHYRTFIITHFGS